jgi:hypothetical protein
MNSDPEPPFMSRWFKAWFAFCALFGIGTVAAIAYGVYLLFVHFGVIA